MTKTKTTTLSAAAESRRVLDQAKAEHARLTASADQAAAAVGELAARLDRGDETVTAIEWATTHAEQEVATRLVEWADRQIKTARTRLINDDTRLADLFIPLVSEMLAGKVQVSTTGNPAEAYANDDGTPVVWIVQPKATDVSGGKLSGSLTLVYLRPSMYAPLDDDKVESLARSAGYAIGMTNGVSSHRYGEQHRDELSVLVHAAAPQVPVLDRAPTDDDAREVGRIVNSALLTAVSGPASRHHDYGNGPRPASSVLATARITTTKQGDTPLIVVETSHQLTPSGLLETGSAHQRITHATVPDLVGTLAPGAGRIVAAESVGITLPSDDAIISNPVWTVRVRLTLAYQL